MPYALCEKIIKEATEEKEKAINVLGKLNQSRAVYYQAGCAIHELALRAKEIYLNPKVTLEERRLLLTYIFSNLTLNEGKLSTNYTDAIEFLTNWLIGTNKIFEPLKIGLNKHKTGQLWPVSTVMRGRGDLNP